MTTSGRNILIIGSYPPPYGGVPHHIEQLSAHLADQGWNCHVLSGGTAGTKMVGKVTVHQPTYMRKAFGFLRQSFNRDFERWLAGGPLAQDEATFWRRYRMFADVGDAIVRSQKIDIVTSYNLLTYAPVGAWLSERHGIPHVISNFGEVFKFASMTRSNRFFAHVAEQAVTRIACSEHCGNSLKRLGVDMPVKPIPHGISTRHFSPGDASVLRQRLDLGTGPVILFVGRLSEEMGLGSFIAAARRVAQSRPDARFIAAGQAGDMMDVVEAAAAEPGSILRLARSVPYPELPLYYRLADIVAVPTHGDRTCSSLAAMEAMATRKPVVAFAVGGVPEIIHEGENGLLAPPEDVGALAAAMLRLINDPAERMRLADNGYEMVHANLDVGHCNRAMEREFLHAIGAA